MALFTAITAVHMALIAFGNIAGYETNHQFVVHVFAMDTTFKSPDMRWRAITDPTLVTIAYLLIIAGETVSALVLIAATVAWLRTLGKPSADTARRLASIGLLMWNGLLSALQNVIVASVALILVHLSQRSPEPTA